MSAPFAENALHLYNLGLAPIPCAGDDGKVPGLRTKGWQRRPGPTVLSQLALKFPEQNVGILTGLSRITVVDIDDARLVAEMLRRFGHTPLMVETPSGTTHLYYRGNGERCTNLRTSEGLPVDVKAVGGFVVVPPSVRLSGQHVGKVYSFAQGGWDALSKLQPIKPGSLPTRPTARPVAPMPDGVRHKDLLNHARKHARSCSDIDELLDVVRCINAECCIPPVPDADVIGACQSAWRYQTEGHNFLPGERRVWTEIAEHEAMKRSPRGADAAMLLAELRFTHYGGRPFALTPGAMAAAGVIPGWAHQRYRDARALLLEIGSIVVVHRGGRGRGDPQLFAFAGHEATRAPAD